MKQLIFGRYVVGMARHGYLAWHIFQQAGDFANNRPELGLQESRTSREGCFLTDPYDNLLTQGFHLDGAILNLGFHLLGQRLGQCI